VKKDGKDQPRQSDTEKIFAGIVTPREENAPANFGLEAGRFVENKADCFLDRRDWMGGMVGFSPALAAFLVGLS
jgi:hypothetical protein